MSFIHQVRQMLAGYVRHLNKKVAMMLIALCISLIGIGIYTTHQLKDDQKLSTTVVNKLSNKHFVATPSMTQAKLSRLAEGHPTFVIFVKKNCPYCQWMKSNNDEVFHPRFTFYRESKHPKWSAGGKFFEFISKQNSYGFKGLTDGGKKLDWSIIKPNWVIVDVESKLGKQLVAQYNRQDSPNTHIKSIPSMSVLNPDGRVAFSVPMTEKIKKNKPATQDNIRYSKVFIGDWDEDGDSQSPIFNEIAFMCGYDNGIAENYYQFLHAQELDPDNSWVKKAKNFQGAD